MEMAKITSKLQVTVPKAIAELYHIRPGDEVTFEPAGDVIRIVPVKPRRIARTLSIEDRLALFDAATARQRERERNARAKPGGPVRGWRREDLYERSNALKNRA